MSPVSAPARFLRSELVVVFGRRRNLVLLAVAALVPVLIALAVRSDDRPGNGGSILGGVTDNGLFAALAALLVTGPVLLPLLVAVVAGDAVAGEAAAGTLRYLLVVPVGRTRLLVTKAGALVVWCAALAGVVAVVGVVTGLVLFGGGDVTLLSGRGVGFGDGLLRVLGATAYVAVGLLVVAALGLAVSTLTEVPLAAMAATLVLVVASQVADAVPQLSAIQPWLPTHHWTAWVDLVRDPVRTDDLRRGLLTELAWIALFWSLAWARFGGRDVTS